MHDHQQPAELTNVTMVAARIVWARIKAGVSIEDIARAVGTTAAVIGMFEAGTIEPTDAQLAKIAERTSVLFFWLKTGNVIAPRLSTNSDPRLSSRLADFAVRYNGAYGSGNPDYPLLCETVGAVRKAELFAQGTHHNTARPTSSQARHES
jgi:transcriptional regulator with XRE-family HTH domain